MLWVGHITACTGTLELQYEPAQLHTALNSNSFLSETEFCLSSSRIASKSKGEKSYDLSLPFPNTKGSWLGSACIRNFLWVTKSLRKEKVLMEISHHTSVL